MATLPAGTVKNGLATTVGTYNPADFKDAPTGSYEAQLYQQYVGGSLGNSTGANNPGAGIVSSSDSVVASENNTKNTVANLTAPDPNADAVKTASDAYIKLLQDQQAQLESRRTADLTGIGIQFDEAKRNATEQQTKEKATTATALQRIGGYLGGSVSAVGAMNNLAQTHQQEITALEAKKAAAIQTANNAINEKQFALAEAMAKEAKQVAIDIADRKDKFFNQSLQLVQEQRQQDEYQRGKYADTLKNLAYVDPTKINPNDLKDIDAFYGIDGFAKSYLEITNAAKKADSEKAALENNQKLVSLLKDIPNGQKVKFPDGTEYPGMGDSGDISTFQETDANGAVRMFAYDKMTGKVKTVNLGYVGKPTDNNSSNPRVTQASDAMKQLVDPTTGYVPVDAYIEMYRDYVKTNNGKGQEFIENLDPLIWTGRAKDFLVKATGDAGGGNEDGIEK